METRRTLIIAPHWDDEAISCGGLIQRRVDQIGADNVYVLFVHDRVYDHGNTDDNDAQIVDMHSAKSILGYGTELSLFLREGEPSRHGFYKLLEAIEHVLKAFDPTEVVIPSASDLNQDHRHLNHVCKIALRPINLRRVKRVLEFFALDGTTKQPNFLVPMSMRRMDVKLDAVAAYSKEARSTGPRSPEAIVAQAVVWGALLGQTYAEAFNLVLEKD